MNNLPAYTASNEPQRWATTAIPNIESVLTVAGSGDQALFYKLAGIKIIDSFDITCNARVIQDIKYAAIKTINSKEYVQLLISLHHHKTDIHQMQNIMQFLPKESCDILQNNNLSSIFGFGLDINYYPQNIPTDTEYEKLRNTLNTPFPFIWSDLETLSAKLSKKYDLINISNIFDYCYNAETQLNILNELSKHLNINGRIVYLPQRKRFSYKKIDQPNLVYEKTIFYDKNTKMILFQRTR